jgi:hypothetical protein
MFALLGGIETELEGSCEFFLGLIVDVLVNYHIKSCFLKVSSTTMPPSTQVPPRKQGMSPHLLFSIYVSRIVFV